MCVYMCVCVTVLFSSCRHFTREALPRLDNYRNMMSIQAAYRPTLDELHNATLVGKVSGMALPLFLSFSLSTFLSAHFVALFKLKLNEYFRLLRQFQVDCNSQMLPAPASAASAAAPVLRAVTRLLHSGPFRL